MSNPSSQGVPMAAAMSDISDLAGNPAIDVPELNRRAGNLTDTLRTMRKWGFTVIHDIGGASQSEEEQMQRARVVG